MMLYILLVDYYDYFAGAFSTEELAQEKADEMGVRDL